MTFRNRLSRVESRRGYRPQPSDADPFWRAIHQQIVALDRDDLEGALSINGDIDIEGIIERRDRAECRRAHKLMMRVIAGLERLAGDDDASG